MGAVLVSRVACVCTRIKHADYISTDKHVVCGVQCMLGTVRVMSRTPESHDALSSDACPGALGHNSQ